MAPQEHDISYNVTQQDFTAALARCEKACEEFNKLPAGTPSSVKNAAWQRIVAPTGRSTENSDPSTFPVPLITAPIRIDYGLRLHIAPSTFINHSCTILDTPVADVRIGERCTIGPNVSIFSVCHNLDPDELGRRTSMGRPVTIGDAVWIGGNVTILPGVKIGSRSTVGAGSVVTKDIPANCVAAGVPAKVVKDVHSVEERPRQRVESLREALTIVNNHGDVAEMAESTKVRTDELLGESTKET
ncbi:putative maltose O-acetyltransferase [Colletotrichum orbiculare MAFF 240422]|uniref:Maltose O-acetyltransferase n=1 Tax=Colletotrichum orbiculare (strain 104-T / ATCC 96160 / CBS 514.97 / LARS 414 / MAFF 240422) TaxID=1213857 RepID=N4VKZ9_COLOR|nr:putative maltose O-acetyltransferase [Colletotrichum orbiculare MAFF 240422]